MLTGLLLCDLVVRCGPLERQARDAWQRVPQALINIAREDYDDEVVMSIFEELRARFEVESVDVRLLIRPSGTEPVVRVMIEALDGVFVDEFRSRLLVSFPS
jgi:phosphoglucosamine mutase